MYGATQTFANAPAGGPFALEACCAFVTLGAFVYTNLVPASYERWHPLGLHAAPGVWSAAVAATHAPLLDLVPSYYSHGA